MSAWAIYLWREMCEERQLWEDWLSWLDGSRLVP